VKLAKGFELILTEAARAKTIIGWHLELRMFDAAQATSFGSRISRRIADRVSTHLAQINCLTVGRLGT